MQRQIIVMALPVEEIIRDLAQHWRMPVEENGGELTIFLPEQLGEGYIRGSSFDSGVGVIQYKCTFYTDYEIQFSKLQTHPLKFIFCSKGLVQHSFQDESELHSIHTYQNVIVSNKGTKGHVLVFKARQACHVTSVEVIRNIFSNRRNYQFKGLDPVLKTLFEDSESTKQFFYQGNYTLKSAEIVEAIEQQLYNGFLRSAFLEGKILEMLVLQITQYQDDQRKDSPQIIRRSELEKIEQAAKIINDDIGRNFAVDDLAQEVGTNVNKLQEGFKIHFDSTVNKYAQHQKLEATRKLLERNELNISDIVIKIGLSNRSYFSKIFKEKYGMSPRYYLSAK